jgi:hypothetical protein
MRMRELSLRKMRKESLRVRKKILGGMKLRTVRMRQEFVRKTIWESENEKHRERENEKIEKNDANKEIEKDDNSKHKDNILRLRKMGMKILRLRKWNVRKLRLRELRQRERRERERWEWQRREWERW